MLGFAGLTVGCRAQAPLPDPLQRPLGWRPNSQRMYRPLGLLAARARHMPVEIGLCPFRAHSEQECSRRPLDRGLRARPCPENTTAALRRLLAFGGEGASHAVRHQGVTCDGGRVTHKDRNPYFANSAAITPGLGRKSVGDHPATGNRVALVR